MTGMLLVYISFSGHLLEKPRIAPNASGISTFIYKNDYRDMHGIEFLLDCGLKVLKYNHENKKLEILSKTS